MDLLSEQDAIALLVVVCLGPLWGILACLLAAFRKTKLSALVFALLSTLWGLGLLLIASVDLMGGWQNPLDMPLPLSWLPPIVLGTIALSVVIIRYQETLLARLTTVSVVLLAFVFTILGLIFHAPPK